MKPSKHPLTVSLVSCLMICATLQSSLGCTIFVLTDTNRTLFANNEDWSNPKTRVWFIPPGEKHFGAMYVGFDDGWAQGGMNTEGLAWDWVAGFNDVWQPDASLTNVWGNSSQQMLDTCATVEEAIAFYRGHRELGFFRARILVADRTGASVIIGAKDGKLLVEQEKQCRGFGYGNMTLDRMLVKSDEPTVSNGFKILRACMQKGQYATKYSNIFDLKSGDIFLRCFSDGSETNEVKLNLAEELKKGAHYYDMSQIREQLTQAPRPLLTNMERFLLAKYKPIPDKQPQVTAHVRAILQNVINDTARSDDYTAEMWKLESSQLKETQKMVKSFGPLVALTLVDHGKEDGRRTYRYRMEFEKTTILQMFTFDEQNKLAASNTEDIR